ncbi:MAG: 1-deoxy-D-xylulose-5-phosphate synthase N-terminal domain-containing protein, partial [Actinomycetota bacterium]
MMLLDALNGPDDLRGRSYEELDDLAEQIRHLIIDSVNEHGGHLGSNLGAVELSIALHRVFRQNEDNPLLEKLSYLRINRPMGADGERWVKHI